jgi:hypothetical protein
MGATGVLVVDSTNVNRLGWIDPTIPQVIARPLASASASESCSILLKTSHLSSMTDIV